MVVVSRPPRRRCEDKHNQVTAASSCNGRCCPPCPLGIVATAASAGLRWGEAAGLRTDALDLDGRTLRVVRTVVEISKHTAFKSFPKSAAGRFSLMMSRRTADWTPPLVVDYEAWRECAIAPEWWSLAAAIEKEVRRSRSWAIRAFMHVWSIVARTVRSPATLTALAVALVGGLVSTFLPPSWVQTVAAVAAVIGGLVGIGQVVGRTLFWHSAPFGRLHLHTEDNPLGQIADMLGWLRGWAPRVSPSRVGQDQRRPILLVIDDLDRCPAERVVKILETVHTILRQPPAQSRPRRPGPARLFVLVLADGRWVRQAFASRFAEFQNPGSTTP